MIEHIVFMATLKQSIATITAHTHPHSNDSSFSLQILQNQTKRYEKVIFKSEDE
jgi:hypothetical protein